MHLILHLLLQHTNANSSDGEASNTHQVSTRYEWAICEGRLVVYSLGEWRHFVDDGLKMYVAYLYSIYTIDLIIYASYPTHGVFFLLQCSNVGLRKASAFDLMQSVDRACSEFTRITCSQQGGGTRRQCRLPRKLIRLRSSDQPYLLTIVSQQ